jgi:hypothetical protein
MIYIFHVININKFSINLIQIKTFWLKNKTRVLFFRTKAVVSFNPLHCYTPTGGIMIRIPAGAHSYAMIRAVKSCLGAASILLGKSSGDN